MYQGNYQLQTEQIESEYDKLFNSNADKELNQSDELLDESTKEGN